MIHAKIAQQLIQAEKEKKPIEPLTTTYPNITVADAYQIQMAQTDQKVSEGATIVGKKIGLTSAVMQEMFQVSTPDYGHLLDDMMIVEGENVSIDDYISPKLECEVAFILKDDLHGPGITAEDVRNATAYVVPAFEVIDSRIRDWDIRFEDTVADNGSCARAVLGGNPTTLDALDLEHIGMNFYKNGRLIDTGAGAAVMGNPLEAVAWLANTLGEYGISLKANEVILSGAITGAVPVEAGEVYTADFNKIGSVTIQFVEGGS